jgi:hypothetical protein
MARNSVPIRSWFHLGPQRGWLLILVPMLDLGVGLSLPARCEAARLGTYLTAQDRSRPLLLAETGTPIPVRDWAHPDPVLPKGTVPAYVAFPLAGGEHLPRGTPTLTSGPQAGGTTVGPLNLNPLVQGELNAALDTSKMAVVETPNRNYAVEFLPRYARTHVQLRTSVGTSPSSAGMSSGSRTTAAASTSASTSTSPSTPQVNPTIDGVPVSELERWAKQGSSQLVHWTSIGVNDLAKSLGIGNSKATATKPGSNLAAQVLVPAQAEESSTSAMLPAPVPEPSTWLVVGLIFGMAGLRQRVTAPGKPGPARRRPSRCRPPR